MFLKMRNCATPAYEKPLKNHPWEVAKKYVETYPSSNDAAHDPEERERPRKPKHYTIYKTEQEKNNKCKKLKPPGGCVQ